METEKKVKALTGAEDFITAKEWRKLGTDDTLKSIEVATDVLDDQLKGEAMDEPSTLARIYQLFDIGIKFQQMAMMVLEGELEKHTHL